MNVEFMYINLKAVAVKHVELIWNVICKKILHLQVFSVDCQFLSRVLQAAERFWILALPYLALPARPEINGLKDWKVSRVSRVSL